MAAAEKTFEKNIMEALDGHVSSFESVVNAVGCLDREAHVLIRMRYMREFTDVQISRVLSIPVDQVEEGVKKALETLKQISSPADKKAGQGR